MENPINIVVKAPNQNIQDKVINCHVGWTVKMLKEHLSDVYPLKPQPAEQKLVYYGKLMPDQSTLNDVLTQEMYNGYHTVHLICPQNSQLPYIGESGTDNLTRADKVKEPNESTNQRILSREPDSSSSSTTTDTNGGQQLRYRVAYAHVNSNSQHHAQQLHNFYQWYTSMYGQAMTDQSPQQALMMQHYRQQALHSTNGFPQSQQFQAPVVEVVAPAQVAQQQQAPRNQRAEDDGVVRMNAQGGVDADAVPNDWLDNLYFFIRILILVLVMYGSINFTRFLMVIGGCIFFYAVQTGLFRPQRRVARPDQLNPEPVQNAAENPQPDNGQEDRAQEGQDIANLQAADIANNNQNPELQAADIANNNQNPEDVRNAQPAHAEPRQSALGLIVESVVAFFMSIFP